MSNVTGILLAAGQSRRFGSNKLLHPMGDGSPLLLHALRRFKAAVPRVAVVVDAAEYEVSALVKAEGLAVVPNPAAKTGMGSSIACGIAAASEADGWVIALADMPWIAPETVRSVVAAMQSPTDIAAPLYNGQRGHPVGFGKGYFEPLRQLSGDRGAQAIVAANGQSLKLIDTADPGILADIDYLQDLPPS